MVRIMLKWRKGGHANATIQRDPQTLWRYTLLAFVLAMLSQFTAGQSVTKVKPFFTSWAVRLEGSGRAKLAHSCSSQLWSLNNEPPSVLAGQVSIEIVSEI